MSVKIDMGTRSPRGMIGGVPPFGRFPFLPSLILNVHLRYRNMSGASFFTGAHHFDASNSTFIEAKTVSKVFAKGIRQASRPR